MHLVDTDVCIDALRGDSDTVDLLAELEAEGRLAVSAISSHELWQGAEGSRDRPRATAAVQAFLAAFDQLPYDADVAALGGRIAGALAKKGASIGDLDTMIAATALHAGATLVTRNEKHFRRVPGLAVRSP